jgi:hypothetical protein
VNRKSPSNYLCIPPGLHSNSSAHLYPNSSGKFAETEVWHFCSDDGYYLRSAAKSCCVTRKYSKDMRILASSSFDVVRHRTRTVQLYLLSL